MTCKPKLTAGTRIRILPRSDWPWDTLRILPINHLTTLRPGPALITSVSYSKQDATIYTVQLSNGRLTTIIRGMFRIED